MDLSQLLKIIKSGESQEVEFKQNFRSGEDISKVLCAFANTMGGLLILGVKTTREVCGLERDLDEIQQKVSAANQAVSPPPLITLEKYVVDRKNILIVVVQKAVDNSYHTFQGAIYVKQGSVTRRLDGRTQLDFLRYKQVLSFDESYSDAIIDDLSREKIDYYLRLRKQEGYLLQHTIQDFILSNRLASKNGSLRIKNTAILLFGKNPELFFPQSEVNLVQFSGNEPVKIANHLLLRGDVVGLIEESILFIEKHISKGIQIDLSARRKELDEYPFSVIREAIVNAITHRDYFLKDAVQVSVFDNRIEITNPGSLPLGLTKELFGTISVQRNPLTYRFLRDMGYVEGLGTGIPRMKNEMRKMGLRDPEFIFTDHFFRIILYNSKSRHKPIEVVSDLNERQKRAIFYLKENKSIKSRTYASVNKISIPMAIIDLNELIQFGFIKKIGKYRGAYYILNNDRKKT